jgi:hypothetical protein
LQLEKSPIPSSITIIIPVAICQNPAAMQKGEKLTAAQIPRTIAAKRDERI